MRTWLINLDRSPERLARMAALLGARGIAFERIAGIDGRTLSQTEIDALSGPNPTQIAMSRSEIGCFLSHRAGLQRIATCTEPFGLILEDDLRLAADAGPLIADTGWIPPDADVVKLETNRRPTLLDRRQMTLPDGRRLARLRGTHLNAGAYIVSRRAAMRILDKTERLEKPLDELIFNRRYALARSLKTYQVTPAPFVQDRLADDPSPSAFLASLLEGDRFGGGERRSIAQKLRREMARPVERLVPILAGGLLGPLTGLRWGAIPFGEAGKTAQA